MSLKVVIPAPLRKFTAGAEIVETEAGMISDVINRLEALYPGIRGSICEPSGSLRRFINIQNDQQFILTVGWCVAAVRCGSPYPVLAVHGEQGSAKSTFCIIVRSLIDPSAAPIPTGSQNG